MLSQGLNFFFVEANNQEFKFKCSTLLRYPYAYLFLLYTPYVGSSVEQSLMIERPVQNYGTAHLGLVFFLRRKAI